MGAGRGIEWCFLIKHESSINETKVMDGMEGTDERMNEIGGEERGIG